MLGPTYIHESYDFVRKGKKKLVLTTYDDFSTIFATLDTYRKDTFHLHTQFFGGESGGRLGWNINENFLH